MPYWITFLTMGYHHVTGAYGIGLLKVEYDTEKTPEGFDERSLFSFFSFPKESTLRFDLFFFKIINRRD